MDLGNKRLAQGSVCFYSAEVSYLQNYIWWVAPWFRRKKKVKETGEDPTKG